LIAGSRVRIPLTAGLFVSCVVVCYVGSRLCDGLITHTEELYRVARVCVCACVKLCVT